MPQMMPINWMISFLFFIALFIIFNIVNYYMKNYDNKINDYKKSNNKNFYWKW